MELYRLTTDLNLRPNPNPNPPSKGVFKIGTVVEGMSTNPENTWLQVRIPKADGGFHEGWMSLRFLVRLAQAPLKWRMGVNLRELAYYGSGLNHVKFTTDAFRDQQLRACRDHGIKTVRFFASHMPLNAEQSIPFIRTALDKLRAFDMDAIVCLDDSLNGVEHQMPGNDFYHAGSEGHLTTNYWRDRAYLQTYIPFIRKIVAEFKEHPSVLMWELGNEFGLYPQPPQAGDDLNFLEFVRIASQEIKNIAPHQRVSIGLITTHVVYVPSRRVDRREASMRLYGLTNIDAVGVHYYQHHLAELKPFIDIDHQVAKDLAKPFYVGEMGAKSDAADRPKFYGDEIDAWKRDGAFTVMPWQLDSAFPNDLGVGDGLGFARWRDGDYQGILDKIKERK